MPIDFTSNLAEFFFAIKINFISFSVWGLAQGGIPPGYGSKIHVKEYKFWL